MLLSNKLDIISDQNDLSVEGDLGSVVDQLMSGKISPDVQLVHGVTPLISSSCGHTDIVEALNQFGSDVNKIDGDTTLDYAKHDDTQHLLLQHNDCMVQS